MKKDLVDAFKDRALRFFEEAVADVNRGWYDFASFHLEQSLQLALKAVLLEKKGSYPFTHDIDELIDSLDDTRLKDLRDRNRDLVTLLKIAYTGSRYFPNYYDREVAVKLIELVKEFLKVLGFMERVEYFKNWRKFAEDICLSLKQVLPDVMVVVFGSVVKGNYVPSLSDIDVMIVSDKVGDVVWQAKMTVYIISTAFKGKTTPFEFHYVDRKSYEEFYREFLKPVVEIRC